MDEFNLLIEALYTLQASLLIKNSVRQDSRIGVKITLPSREERCHWDVSLRTSRTYLQDTIGLQPTGQTGSLDGAVLLGRFEMELSDRQSEHDRRFVFLNPAQAVGPVGEFCRRNNIPFHVTREIPT